MRVFTFVIDNSTIHDHTPYICHTLYLSTAYIPTLFGNIRSVDKQIMYFIRHTATS